MTRPAHNSWIRVVAGFGLIALLLALLAQPLAVHAVHIAPIVLAPLVLFGLVIVPRTLWPATNLEQRFAPPVLSRADRFQRPPPQSFR